MSGQPPAAHRARLRRRWHRDGQPVAAVAATVAAGVALALSVTGGPTGPAQATLADAVSAGSQAQATSQTQSSSLLPGQSTPAGIALQAGPGKPAGDSRVVRLTVAGRERGYLLLPPLGGAEGPARGLLVVLHQDIGSARAVAEGLGLDPLRRSGIALAYPAGVGGSWNAGTCCGVAQREGVDDVAFVNAVLEDATRRTGADANRRGLVGYSGGGMLAYRLMCAPHPALAAVVEVSGSLEVPCPAAVRLPDLLALHGARDGTVGLTKPIRVTHLGMAPRPVADTLDLITRAGGCTGRTVADAPGTRLVGWRSCRGGATVQVEVVRAAGHGWDDIGAAGRAMPYLLARLAG